MSCHRTIIVTLMKKVSDFVHCSRLIAKLVNDCGYDGNTEFGTFLRELEISESANDIAAILLSPLNNSSAHLCTTIPIDRIIEILDELAAHKRISALAKQRIKLSRISDTQIINHALTDMSDITNAYIDGYRVICDSATNEIKFESQNIQSISNALYNAAINGLPITNVSLPVHIFCPVNIPDDNLRDITRLQFTYDSPKYDNNNLSKCTNLQDLDMRNVCITAIDTTPFAKTLKTLHMQNCVTIPTTMITQCPNLQSLYIDGKQSYTLSQHPLPSNLRTLSICNTKFVAVKQILNKKIITHSKDINNLDTKPLFDDGLRNIFISDIDGGLGDAELQCCTRIKKLYAIDNPYVTLCDPFHKSLKVLHATHNRWIKDTFSKIGNVGLQLCTSIKELNASSNMLVTTCEPFAYTLKTLIATEVCGIGDDGLQMCNRLTKVNVTNNERVTTCAPFAKSLKTLIISGPQGKICDDGLALCSKIKHLNISNNPTITTCEPFAKTLEILSASISNQGIEYNTGLSDAGLASCTNIKHLSIYNNKNITSCKPFAKSLETLIASSSAITNDGISLCANLKKLAINITSITSIAPFTNTLVELSMDCGNKNMIEEGKLCTNMKKVCIISMAGLLQMCNGDNLRISRFIAYDVFGDAVAMNILYSR